ncbi:hypothetical protein PRIPAC_77741 [Pristionchus pacificus]|uniref:Uncharacterized protein n=1 Tax=Pristionchus pacificus TaxID=54126 RepID=A0A2A6CM67_PRIPA|nr:hypothetical protein PRIPAC_77741 [Pristionchus pacificus]|eukprot:PDM79292.1 hypothetical protein PRIPAC_31871 [Pristionchus pacificus]
MEDDPVDPALVAQVEDLKKQFTFLSHQMSAIAAKLAAPPCPCATCAAIGPQFLQGLSVQPHLQHARAACLAAAARTAAAPAAKQSAPSENGSSSGDEIKEIPPPTGSPAVNGHHHLPNGTPLTPVLLQTTANLYAGWGAENNPHGGRKSKHCTPEQKIAVAEYAAVHGAANAARKFDIPPSVAAYYHRKLAKAKQIDATAAVLGASVLQKTEDGSPVVDLSMLAPSPDVRQRGRPKMIGDKLDADLMEFMIKVGRLEFVYLIIEINEYVSKYAKADNPQLQNLRPEVALEMARAYIANHSPTKLKENGGHIDLKLSWAQKLVSRIAERESEIALGLPHGSLSNGGLKQLVNININDLLALASAMPATEEEEPMNESNTDIAMPEITSGKELSLDDFLGVGGKLVEDDDDLMPVAQIE